MVDPPKMGQRTIKRRGQEGTISHWTNVQGGPIVALDGVLQAICDWRVWAVYRGLHVSPLLFSSDKSTSFPRSLFFFRRRWRANVTTTTTTTDSRELRAAADAASRV